MELRTHLSLVQACPEHEPSLFGSIGPNILIWIHSSRTHSRTVRTMCCLFILERKERNLHFLTSVRRSSLQNKIRADKRRCKILTVCIKKLTFGRKAPYGMPLALTCRALVVPFRKGHPRTKKAWESEGVWEHRLAGRPRVPELELASLPCCLHLCDPHCYPFAALLFTLRCFLLLCFS